MAPREPTRAQLSSKLSYQANVPAFLQKFQNKMKGIQDEDEDEDYDAEFEHVGGGRAPIPRRPAIPERPADNPGSADEDDEFADEKPQVVVLKEGKHLTEREAENVRRAEKGLPPLPEPKIGEQSAEYQEDSSKETKVASSKSGLQGLSFSSSSKPTAFKGKKRKAVGQLDDLKTQIEDKSKDGKGSKEKGPKTSSKKAKKTSKTLLSFGDDA